MPQLTWLGDSQAKQQRQCVPYALLQTISQHGVADSPNLLIESDHLRARRAGVC